ncbi:hypothetical protein RN001_008992 [Aquatica leii]|uniref:Uncharacterized protein n=1 Tax=Aquatica leii TaxID=1421715 RepID=A0AAN7S9Z3_9COLE|nr:hypothetical protein RN001_008992 [Aquatica leii]
MSASTILNLFACGVLSDQELIEAYEDVVERMVIYGDTIDKEDEGIFLRLIERVIELKDTAKIEAPSTSAAHLNNSVGFGLTPSTSRNGDYDKAGFFEIAQQKDDFDKKDEIPLTTFFSVLQSTHME